MTSEIDDTSSEPDSDVASVASLATRGTIGGVLMGLANLVPGISGGTMLLAAGVYPRFISAIAEVTTLKFRPRSMVVLADGGKHLMLDQPAQPIAEGTSTTLQFKYNVDGLVIVSTSIQSRFSDE